MPQEGPVPDEDERAMKTGRGSGGEKARKRTQKKIMEIVTIILSKVC